MESKFINMKFIAHRGLFNGPDIEKENSPEQLIRALSEGYDCEVDLWVVNSETWLGHDAPTYLVDRDFLREAGFWIHAKNLAALRWLADTNYKYFWHQNDDFTITSNGLIWTYPGKELTGRSIMCMPEHADPTLANVKNVHCYAICSDYVEQIKLGLIPLVLQ
jgi:hypothetical protein